MKMRPLFARVLLRREKLARVGSLLVPSDVQKKHATLKCKVIAKGPTADEDVPLGANVLLGRFAGDWINAEGKPVTSEDDDEFFICQDEDILAVLEE